MTLPFCLFGTNSAPSPVKGAPAGEAFTLDQMVQWKSERADSRHPAEQPPSQAIRATPQYLVFPARRAYHIVEPITISGEEITPAIADTFRAYGIDRVSVVKE